MKTNNIKTIKLLALLFLAVTTFTFTSCDDDDDDDDTPIVNTHDDAYADVLLKKMNTPMGIRYKEIFFAGGIDIVEVESKVTTPDGTIYPLVEFWAGAGKVQNVMAPMYADKMEAGDYSFSLKFTDGYEKTIVDTLEDVELDLAMPFTVDYVQGDDHMTVNWTLVPNADLICVKITEIDPATGMPKDAKPYFKKAQLAADATSLTINFDGAEGWMRSVSELETDTNYFLSVAAKKVEAGAEISGASLDFQTSSCVKTTFAY